MTGRRPPFAVRVARRSALGFVWILSVLLAGGLGWSLARIESGGRSLSRPAARAPAIAQSLPEPIPSESFQSLPVPPEPAPAPTEPPAEPAAPLPAEPAPPPQTAMKPKPAVQPPVVPEPAPVPGPLPDLADPATAQQPATALPDTELFPRALEVDRLAELGQDERARREAAALLAAHPSYTGLTAAFVAAGADEPSAHLTTLRLLQLAGLESISREVARELKQIYASRDEVNDSIRRWGILKPRIVSLESAVEKGRYVVVTGTLENPDVAIIRRVRIEVEALDGAGNRLDATEAFARPKVLAPGTSGEFTVKFRGLDPVSVLQTRATIVAWESEVLDAGG